MHSFYEIFPDLGGFFCWEGCWFLRELRGKGVEGWWFFFKVKGWIIWVGEGDFFVCIHPYVKG